MGQLALKHLFILAEKRTNALIFHFKLCGFCYWGRKNVICPRAQGTLATTAQRFC